MILYKGPSRIDGKPIVVIATINSVNAKTGDMVQTWILREDISPVKAFQTKQDYSICGDCKLRNNLGGACYVTIWQAPYAIYQAYKRGTYDKPSNIRKVSKALANTEIRIGSYGDPCAVPFHVWESLIAQGNTRYTGYTHQWKDKKNQEYRKLLMASVDTIQEAQLAHAMGWRFFLVLPDVESPPTFTSVVECPSTASDRSCADCTICDGTRADSRSTTAASIAIQVHGHLAKRFLTVIR